MPSSPSKMDTESPPSNTELVSQPSKTDAISTISNLNESQRSFDTFSEFSSRYYPRTSVTSLVKARDRVWQTCQTKRERRRLIFKNGDSNVSNSHVKRRHQRYLADIFTTLVDIKWRWILLLFVLAFISSWMLFALIWWLICLRHKDFDNLKNEKWIPCVQNVEDYTTALLFSIETQHTIGYGSRMTTRECPDAIIAMMIQSCFGVIIQALMTGVVFAKLARSKKRAETLMFSKHAVICRRDGHLSLLFRVGDMRRSHIIQTTVRGVLIKKHITQEGEVLPLAESNVPFGTESGSNSLLLIWPLILEHCIDESSPFWEMSPIDLYSQNFELVIVLEGVIESTGLTTQARTSYLPAEILWGHRFERLVAFQKENGQYSIDYSRFDSTVKVETPRCSAQAMHEGDEEIGNPEDDDDDYSGTESSNETETNATDRDVDISTPRKKSGQLLNISDLGRSLSRISASSTVPTVCQNNSFTAPRGKKENFVTSSPLITLPSEQFRGSGDQFDVNVILPQT